LPNVNVFLLSSQHVITRCLTSTTA
jgi:hypothetical protein